MRPHTLPLAIALAGVFAPAAAAQHEGQQPAVTQPSAPLAQCAQVQPAVENIIAAATARLESARQSNDPSQLRAAVDHLQGALRDLRTELAPCAAGGAAAAAPHAGHAMPPSTKPPAAPVDPHAGHEMPAAKPAAKPSKTKPKTDTHAGHGAAPPKAAPPKASPPKTSKPPAVDPHAEHRSAAPAKPAGKQRDPVTGLMVDPATAPSTTHQGETYYFSSEASKKEFLENPAKFARKPKR